MWPGVFLEGFDLRAPQIADLSPELLFVAYVWKVRNISGLNQYKSRVNASVQALQFYLSLYEPMDCSLPDSSVHGILWARILEWVAMPSSRGSS